ncbi:MAG: sigma-70 family RNA polymerase sigma factor [Planctomycetaceae bacterium]|nr:sigma-70 family RNA polymerase sigma factor [Planctomycetaceae bacterium]
MADPLPPDDLRSGGSTSRSLLADARRSMPAAWERLVRLYAPLVASWVRRGGVAEQDVVDVVQDVFSAVFGNFKRFRKERRSDTFRGWLATISRNKVNDHFRRRTDEPCAPGGTEASLRIQQILDPHPPFEPQEGDEDILLDGLLRTALEAIRGEFHERTWKAFWGTVVEGRAAADVAADLEMKPGTVRVAKSRVLLRLRRELGDVPDDFPSDE